MQPNELLQQLQQHCGFETVEAQQPQPQMLRLMGRVRQDRIGDWVLVVHALLNGQGNGWTVDISKNYFLRGGKVVYAWRLLLQAEDLVGQLPSIVAVIRRTPRGRVGETMEMPLLGASRNRNIMVKGKGAGPTGTVAVGPALILGGGAR